MLIAAVTRMMHVNTYRTNLVFIDLHVRCVCIWTDWFKLSTFVMLVMNTDRDTLAFTITSSSIQNVVTRTVTRRRQWLIIIWVIRVGTLICRRSVHFEFGVVICTDASVICWHRPL